MDDVAGVPVVRVNSRLQLFRTFFVCPSNGGGQQYRRRRRRQQGSSAGQLPPAPMMVDVRIVIRCHFPAVVVGPDGVRATRTVEEVAEDIALRRRASRKLRGPELVERALAEEVLPLVRHEYDRGAVVTASRDICDYVSAACADARLAQGGVHVLVLVDTFASPGVLLPDDAALPPPACDYNKLTTTMMMQPRSDSGGAPKSLVVTRATAESDDPCMELKRSWMPPAKETRHQSPLGVIGDKRPKPVAVVDERFNGWLPR